MIKPTVVVGPYGYNSKDFIVAAHGRSFDDNGDGVIDSKDGRNLEFVVGTTNPRMKTVSAAGGKWEVTADLSPWAAKITAGEIKRVEIAVLPSLTNAAGVAVGVTATSKTFDLTTKAFDDSYFKTAGVNNIVSVESGCNNCHAQLGTTFHSPAYGGSVTVCRICHEVSSQGSHLELQSRSIDSYVHAIHSFQAFDPGDVNFGDPVESMEYEHKINSTYPTFGILNCESCHKAGKYEVPDQAKSMPGALSGTDAVEGRNIGTLLPSVTGPAVRACGGCHRAQVINADDASGLSVLNQHFRTFGYMIEAPTTEITALWQSAVAKIMAMFK
jgi:OmcA/MtrC family decaheme c-type cytochrome